jgi:hypothetical protein
MDARLKALQELYDALPTVACQGKCANACGAIDMSVAEHGRIVELGYLIPRMTEELAQRWRDDEPLHCPALNRQTLRCEVYEARPMICRLWGVADSMPCPHGCKPTRELNDSETYSFLFASMRDGGGSISSALGFAEIVERADEFLEQLKDPEVGPLIARFIRGDRSVEEQLARIYQERNGRAR